MSKKKIILLIFLLLIFLVYFKLIDYKKKNNVVLNSNEEKILAPNLIKNVIYSAQDNNGNIYDIKAEEGEIDLTNKNIIYLKEIEAIIQLSDKSIILIKSKFGRYNSLNYDTIFNQDVFMQVGENKLNAEKLDFSLDRGSIILSENIKYKNLNNLLKADVIEVDLKTKNSKIYMNDTNKKMKIQSLE